MRRAQVAKVHGDHQRKAVKHRFKIVARVYREPHTGRLKTQFIDDWATPRETARRYNRNGIEKVAAVTYEGPVSPEGNAKVLLAWSAAATAFGFGPDDRHYGWLREGSRLADVEAFYASRLVAINHRTATPPGSVRRSYNKSEGPEAR